MAALTDYTRRRLASVLGNTPAAAEVKTAIDADGGTLSPSTRRRIWNVFGTQMGVALVAAIEADSALSVLQKGKLTQLVGETALTEINADQGEAPE